MLFFVLAMKGFHFMKRLMILKYFPFKRGESVGDFLPHPHYILMADCIYYEQVL